MPELWTAPSRCPQGDAKSSRRGTVVCSYSVTFVGTGGEGEEDLPLGWTFTGTGTVTVKVVGGR